MLFGDSTLRGWTFLELSWNIYLILHINLWGWKQPEKKRILQLERHLRFIHFKDEDMWVHKWESFAQDHTNWKAEMDPKPRPPFSLIVLLTSVSRWQWNTCKWQIILLLVRKRGKQRITFFSSFLFFLSFAQYLQISVLCERPPFMDDEHQKFESSWSSAGHRRNISSRIILPVSYSNLLTSLRKGVYFSLIKR